MVNNEEFIGCDKFVLDKFEFESGSVLENVVVEYLAKGTPEYDEEGNITNAIIYCHRFNQTYHSINDLYRLTAKGKPLDFEKYYFISITSLGFPNSCSPSTTGLKHNFPKYTILDRVNFKRQFLKERFGIDINSDFSVWDLSAQYTVDPQEFLSMGRATPFEGEKLYGKCIATIHNGKIVYKG